MDKYRFRSYRYMVILRKVTPKILSSEDPVMMRGVSKTAYFCPNKIGQYYA